MGVAFGSEEMVKNGRRDSYPFAIMPLADRNLDEVVKKRSSPSSFDFLKYWMSPESMNSAIGNDDAITKASDVFQLAALFWFAATKLHPTGIVKANDWCGPLEIFKVLVSRFHMIHNLGQKTGAISRANLGGSFLTIAERTKCYLVYGIISQEASRCRVKR